MRVAIYQGGSEPVVIQQLPDPVPAADEVVIEIGRCGLCGSDVTMTGGGEYRYPFGCRMGHEYAGTVVAKGAGVVGLAIGDKVTATPLAECGGCDMCRRGHPMFCTALKGLNGGFADYIAVPASATLALPVGLSLADGALVEPGACGLRALEIGGLRQGDHVVVLGAGSMAVAAVYWARRLGAGAITVVSRSSRRREWIMAVGADSFHSLAEDDPRALELQLDGGADVVVECVGKAGALAQSLELVRPGGTVISAGMCTQAEPVTAAGVAGREAKMVFPIAYSRDQFERTLRAFDADTFPIGSIVSEVIGLGRLPATIEALRAGAEALKIHVDPHVG